MKGLHFHNDWDFKKVYISYEILSFFKQGLDGASQTNTIFEPQNQAKVVEAYSTLSGFHSHSGRDASIHSLSIDLSSMYFTHFLDIKI